MRFRGSALALLTLLFLLGVVASADAKPKLSIADSQATEGGRLRFAIALKPKSNKPVTADYRTKPGTASQEDFTAAKGSIKLKPGKTSATVVVKTADDSADEQDERLTVSLSDSRGAKLGEAKATGTILDDDDMAPGSPDLVIIEFLANPGTVADADGEWIEIYNAGTGAADMSDVELLTGGDLRCTLSGSVAAGAYYVVAGNSNSASNGGINADKGCSLSLLNTSSTIAVREAPAGSTIDSTSYTSSTTGKSRALDPDFLTAAGNDDPANSCDATSAYGTGGDLGTPGAANLECPDEPPPSPPTDLVISEFLANPSVVLDVSGEWIEIYNAGTGTADMSGAELLTGGTLRCTLTGSVAAGAYYVVAGSTDTGSNGGVNADAGCPLSLLNSSSTIEVRQAPGGTTIDSTSYPSSTVGKARGVDPDFLTAIGNDNSTNFCDAVAAFGTGGDLGTPKAANPQCP